MNPKNNRRKKTTIINFRVTEQQKQKIQKDAKALDMSVTQYLSHIAEHHSVVIVPGGKELAEAVYHLNSALAKWERYPCIPIQDLQDTVSRGINRINFAMEEGAGNVNPEI